MSVETRLEIKKRGITIIPAPIRRKLGLKEGDEIVVKIVGVVNKTIVPIGEKTPRVLSREKLDDLVGQWVAFLDHVKKNKLQETMRYIAADPVAACAEALQITQKEAEEVIRRVTN